MPDPRLLSQARKQKRDEFYTQLADIENELQHYTDHFKGKVVYCNCDDPRSSNFVRYFINNFETLGLKKLIATCYSNPNLELFNTGDQQQEAFLLEHDRLSAKPRISRLSGDGDFRSLECVNLMRGSDIICTNPPFSLFRDYVDLLNKHDKRFLIVGHQNCVTYKNVFPLIKNGRVWLGHGFENAVAHFVVTEYDDYAKAGAHQEGTIRVSGVVWFTNLDHNKRHQLLKLSKQYKPAHYPQYDNYDAIEVSKVADIPVDYTDKMGVPITFLWAHNPAQFEIVGFRTGYDNKHLRTKTKSFYNRIIIRRTNAKEQANEFNKTSGCGHGLFG